jgi:hypothetical protein
MRSMPSASYTRFRASCSAISVIHAEVKVPVMLHKSTRRTIREGQGTLGCIGYYRICLHIRLPTDK